MAEQQMRMPEPASRYEKQGKAAKEAACMKSLFKNITDQERVCFALIAVMLPTSLHNAVATHRAIWWGVAIMWGLALALGVLVVCVNRSRNGAKGKE